jgi:hypothetical protein
MYRDMRNGHGTVVGKYESYHMRGYYYNVLCRKYMWYMEMSYFIVPSTGTSGGLFRIM